MDLLKSIEVFLEVCKWKSFSQAADQLNLVPSAVSRQINELEKYLNVRLLYRTTRSVSLTDDGRRYLRKMEEITHSAQELTNLSSTDNTVKDHIRVTAPPILSPALLNKVIYNFLGQYPDISLSITLVNREINLVEEGYDLALRVGRLDDSNLVARNIGQFPLSVVASPAYLGTHGMPKHPKELTRHNCIINTLTQSPRRWLFREGKREYSVKVDGRYDANDDAILQRMACANLGIVYLPRYVVDEKINSGELVSILEKYIPDPFPISLVYPSRHYLSKAKRLLIEYFKDNAEFLDLLDKRVELR